MTDEQREAPQTYTCASPAMTCTLPSGISIHFKDGVYRAETQGEVNDFEAFLVAQKPVHRSKYNRIDYQRAAQIVSEHLAGRDPMATHGVSTTTHQPHPVNVENALQGQANNAVEVAKEIAALAEAVSPAALAANVKPTELPVDPNPSLAKSPLKLG